jgi:hypothetical protein
MSEYTPSPIHQLCQVLLAGEPLRYYRRIVERVVWLGWAVIVLSKIGMVVYFGVLAAIGQSGLIDWLIAVAIFVAIGMGLWKRHGATYQKAVVAGGVAGIYFGLGLAVIELILFRNTWALANLIRKPLFFLFIGMAVTTFTYLVGKKNSFRGSCRERNKHY